MESTAPATSLLWTPVDTVQHVLSGLLLFGTIASMIPSACMSNWLIRGWDFPRLQLFTLGSFALLLQLGQRWWWTRAWTVLGTLHTLAVLAALVVQGTFIFPYTPFARKMSRDASSEQSASASSPSPRRLRLPLGRGRQPTGRTDRDVSILVANVLYENRICKPLLEDILEHDPDVLVFDEVDDVWLRKLKPVTADYPYRVEVPQTNCYGLAMYSKLPVREAQIRHLVERDVPSIFCVLTLRCGVEVSLICLHPEPPSPTGNTVSTERDAELMLVAKHVRALRGPVIVTGDLNDVAWSRTTSLFLRMSRLCDPRVGRGFYNTFHASVPFMRWSLDHIFHSTHFAVVQLRRLRYFGSDHFPLLLHLRYEPPAPVPAPPPPPPLFPLRRGQNTAAEGAGGAVRVRDDRKPLPDIALLHVQAALQPWRPDVLTTPPSPLHDAPVPVRLPTPAAPVPPPSQEGRAGIRAQTRALSSSDREEADLLILQAAERAPIRPPPPADKPPDEGDEAAQNGA